MKKIVGLLVGLLMVFGVAGSASAGGQSADWAGEYYLDSMTVTPVGTTDWETSAAELVVGGTYDVAVTAVYDDDNLSDDYPYVPTTTLALSIGSTTWTDDANAYGIVYGPDGEENDVDFAYYDFEFDITITDSMLSETIASFMLTGGGQYGCLSQDLGDYDINVSAVPEPGTFILFGVGMLGLAKVTRRKRK